MSTEADVVEGTNALTALVIRYRREGKNYPEIGRLVGQNAAQVEEIEQLYLRERAAKIDPVTYRLLQLERLEGLVDMLHGMVMLGNVKASESLGRTLEQISQLLGLNLQTEKHEVKIITDTQATVVFDIALAVGRELLRLVTHHLEGVEGAQGALALIEEQWDATMWTGFSAGTKEIETLEAKVVG